MVDRIGEYRDAGADWVILALRAPFDVDGLDRFAAEVLPALHDGPARRRGQRPALVPHAGPGEPDRRPHRLQTTASSPAGHRPGVPGHRRRHRRTVGIRTHLRAVRGRGRPGRRRAADRTRWSSRNGGGSSPASLRALGRGGREAGGLRRSTITSSVPVGVRALVQLGALGLAQRSRWPRRAGSIPRPPGGRPAAPSTARCWRPAFPGGLMDQLCSLFGVPSHAVLIDCRSLDTRRRCHSPARSPYLVAHSGISRTLAGSAYAERRAWSRSGRRARPRRRSATPPFEQVRATSRCPARRDREPSACSIRRRAGGVPPRSAH